MPETEKAASKEATERAVAICEQIVKSHDPLDAEEDQPYRIIAAALDAFAEATVFERPIWDTAKRQVDALRERNRALVEALRRIDYITDINQSGFHTSEWQARESELVARRALAADAKAGEDR